MPKVVAAVFILSFFASQGDCRVGGVYFCKTTWLNFSVKHSVLFSNNYLVNPSHYFLFVFCFLWGRSYISTAAGFFKNTREVLEKHGPQASASRVFLKIPKCLYNSTMHEEQVSHFLYKIETQKQIPLLVLKLSNYKSNLLIDKTPSFLFCFFNKTKISFLTLL